MQDTKTTPVAKDAKTGEILAKPNPGDLLACGEYVMRIEGRPMHHTSIYDALKKHGLWTDKSKNVNPRIWNDWLKDKAKTRFRFYGGSVFGLKAWGKDYPEATTDPDPFRPARGTVRTQEAVTVETVNERIARLNRELVDAQKALAELKKG